MTSPSPMAAGATAQQLLLTAERLFAQRGLEGVSLRQIGAEAGSANNNAVQYHFGSKAGLVSAIFAFRVSNLLERRKLLRARADPDDLRSRVEAQILPLFELAESRDSHYVSFVEQLERTGSAYLVEGSESVRATQDDFEADMRRLLANLPEPVRWLRIHHLQTLSLHAAAERERAVNHGDAVLPFAVFVSAAIDNFAGLLAAPLSEETEKAVARWGSLRAGGPSDPS